MPIFLDDNESLPVPSLLCRRYPGIVGKARSGCLANGDLLEHEPKGDGGLGEALVLVAEQQKLTMHVQTGNVRGSKTATVQLRLYAVARCDAVAAVRVH